MATDDLEKSFENLLATTRACPGQFAGLNSVAYSTFGSILMGAAREIAKADNPEAALLVLFSTWENSFSLRSQLGFWERLGFEADPKFDSYGPATVTEAAKVVEEALREAFRSCNGCPLKGDRTSTTLPTPESTPVSGVSPDLQVYAVTETDEEEDEPW